MSLAASLGGFLIGMSFVVGLELGLVGWGFGLAEVGCFGCLLSRGSGCRLAMVVRGLVCWCERKLGFPEEWDFRGVLGIHIAPADVDCWLTQHFGLFVCSPPPRGLGVVRPDLDLVVVNYLSVVSIRNC